MKRLNNLESYTVETERALYLVTLEGLKNDVNGNRRFKAIIHILNVKEETKELKDNQYIFNAVYQFKGHYLGSLGECKNIVKVYEEELKEKGVY